MLFIFDSVHLSMTNINHYFTYLAKTIYCNTDQAMRKEGKPPPDGRRMESRNKAAQLPSSIAQPDPKHSDPIYSNNDSSLFQGDIFLNPEQRAFLESGINIKCMIEVGDLFIIIRIPDNSGSGQTSRLSAKLDSQWPNGIIPVQFSQEFTDSEKCIIKKHMMEINQQTCVKIVPRTSEEHYVLINKELGCSSPVGFNPKYNPSSLSLDTNCITGDWTRNT